MAEIKSTLDLVMERTSHLSMSTEEKAGQQQKDFEKKVQGLLQQYEDNILSVDDLLEKSRALQAELHIDDQMLLVSAVVQRIQPDQNSAQWLALVRRLAPAARSPMEEALADYREKVSALVLKSEKLQLEHLARKYGIQGSAAAPNLQKEAPHQEALVALKSAIRTRIEEALQP